MILLNCRFEVVTQISMRKLFGREVNSHGQGAESGVGGLPGAQALAGFSDYPLPDGNHESGAFCDFNEFGRGNHALLRMMPAHQGFEPHRLPALEIQDGW